MKARIIEVEREEIAPGLFRRLMWSNVPVDQLSYSDTQEFFDRTDEMWPAREAMSSLVLQKIQQDKKKRPNHFFETLSSPPQKEEIVNTQFSKN